MRLRGVDVVLVVLVVLVSGCGGMEIEQTQEEEQQVARDFFERTIMGLMSQRRVFLDGFGNATEIMERKYEDVEGRGSPSSARGKKKRLKQINRTLVAIVLAYTLKFMFLIPTFIGTLVLFKFTAALAGFFYALFAAVLGLDPRHPEH